jgi:hypothetical protein
MSRLLSIDISHFSDALHQKGGGRNDGLTNEVKGFSSDVLEDCKPAFMLHEHNDRLISVYTYYLSTSQQPPDSIFQQKWYVG